MSAVSDDDDNTTTSISDIVEATKSEIAEMVLNGIVPHTITDFGDLHSYTDANMIADALVERYQQETGKDWIEFIPAVQDEVHAWMSSGALQNLPRPPQ